MSTRAIQPDGDWKRIFYMARKTSANPLQPREPCAVVVVIKRIRIIFWEQRLCNGVLKYPIHQIILDLNYTKRAFFKPDVLYPGVCMKLGTRNSSHILIVQT